MLLTFVDRSRPGYAEGLIRIQNLRGFAVGLGHLPITTHKKKAAERAVMVCEEPEREGTRGGGGRRGELNVSL